MNKLSGIFFIGIVLMALLGLGIMDYQLRQANDITGQYISVNAGNILEENQLAGGIIIGVLIVIGVAIIVSKAILSDLSSKMPLHQLDATIRKLDKELKGR
ncbi:hypothetical protein HQ545_01980 [Candidatus Woesearchaeota archaeon]|nr:hypothetical protein [Candidatus Woesearchaeota archaeon]